MYDYPLDVIDHKESTQAVYDFPPDVTCLKESTQAVATRPTKGYTETENAYTMDTSQTLPIHNYNNPRNMVETQYAYDRGMIKSTCTTTGRKFKPGPNGQKKPKPIAQEDSQQATFQPQISTKMPMYMKPSSVHQIPSVHTEVLSRTKPKATARERNEVERRPEETNLYTSLTFNVSTSRQMDGGYQVPCERDENYQHYQNINTVQYMNI